MTKTKAQQAAEELDESSRELVAVRYKDGGKVRRVDVVSAKSLLNKGTVELADVPEPAEDEPAPIVVLDGRTE